MFPTNFTYVQPNSAASEGSSDLDHRDEMDTESHTYDGVRKVTGKSIYIAEVRDNDETKGEQLIHLGKFDKDVNAARAHDMVALKLGGSGVKTNFPETQYKSALEAMTDMSKTEVVDSVRMLSFTFTRAISIYRGVSRDFSTGKWQADLDEGNDNRIFLGLFESEEEAARAYDIESIKLKGLKAITNFSIRFYNVDAILLGETDPEKVMYQPQFTVPLEAMQAFDEVLYNITGQGNVNREGVQEFQMSTVSGKTEEHANSTNVPLQRETDSTHVVNGSEEGSTPREKFEAYMKFIKRQT